MDETYGPVAVSVRREKLDDIDGLTDTKDKDSSAKYQYRVIFRMSEVRLRDYLNVYCRLWLLFLAVSASLKMCAFRGEL